MCSPGCMRNGVCVYVDIRVADCNGHGDGSPPPWDYIPAGALTAVAHARTPNSPQPHICCEAGTACEMMYVPQQQQQQQRDRCLVTPVACGQCDTPVHPKNQQSWQPPSVLRAACALHQPAALPPRFVTQPPLPLLASHFLIHPFASLKLVAIFKCETCACK